ncbi:SemiSWEET family transporter [Mycoplasma sp. 613B]
MILTQIIVGILAIIITPFSTVPQLYKTFKTKHVGVVSFTTFWVLWLSYIFWIFYSIFKNEISIFMLNCKIKCTTLK